METPRKPLVRLDTLQLPASNRHGHMEPTVARLVGPRPSRPRAFVDMDEPPRLLSTARPQQLGVKSDTRRAGLVKPCPSAHPPPSRKNGMDHQRSDFSGHRHHGLRPLCFRHLANRAWHCAYNIGKGLVLRPYGLALRGYAQRKRGLCKLGTNTSQ